MDGRPVGSNPDLKIVASKPKTGATPCHNALTLRVLYTLHLNNIDTSIQAGAEVMSLADLCPPFYPAKNSNLFQHYFGIEFNVDDQTFVQPISPFEFTRCYDLTDNLTYKLSHPKFIYSAENGIPSRTSAWLFDHCLERLLDIRNANCQIFDPSHYAAPAALCQVFVSGTIGACLPNTDTWRQAYGDDEEMCLLRDMIMNPSKVIKVNLDKVQSSYRGPLCHKSLQITMLLQY